MPSAIINQGADPDFDETLIDTCTIYQRGPLDDVDDYGLENQTLISLLSAVPCRVSRRTGREFKQDKQSSVTENTIYMLPVSLERTVTTGVTETVPLDHTFVLLVGSTQYNILDVQNPSNLNHHLEVLVERVIA